VGNEAATRDDDAERREARRDLLRVALGAAAAGATFAAPRVSGLSLAPDYAAAATCEQKSNNSAITGGNGIYCAANTNCGANDVTNGTNNYSCWGGDNGTCGCTSKNFTATSVTLGNLSPTTITMNAVAGGRSNTRGNCNNNGQGTLAVTLSGITGNRSCTVNMNSTPNQLVNTTAMTFNANGTQNRTDFRSGSNGTSAQTATLTLTCNC